MPEPKLDQKTIDAQNRQILEYLKVPGNTLTQETAKTLFKCWRLAARIWDLREYHLIVTGWGRSSTGQRIGLYYYMRPMTEREIKAIRKERGLLPPPIKNRDIKGQMNLFEEPK